VPRWLALGDNSVVPHHDDPGIPKDLLHEVNDQLEIVVGAAELLSQKSSDPSVTNYCEQIQSAVFRTSKLLKMHFNQPLTVQPGRDAVNQPNLSAIVDRA
jgi:nitrogen-specific signal transduction histidine kinase